MIPALGAWLVAVSSTSFQACAPLPAPAVEPECRVYPGLTPGTSVAYEVAGATGTAWTLPASGPVRFAVLGDSGKGGPDQFAVARRLELSDSRFVLHTGDVVYPSGELEDYGPKYFAPYRASLTRMAVYPAVGNHDYANDYLLAGRGRKRFDEAYRRVHRRPPYYSFDAGPAHFVSLDTNAAFHIPAASDTGPGSPQDEWLRADLAASSAPWKIVFLHVPLHSNVSHGDYERLRAWLAPILHEHNIQLVLQGHVHCYERTAPIDGTTFVTVGTGGASLSGSCEDKAPKLFVARAGVFGLLFGELDGDRLTMRFENIEGKTLDRFVLTR